MAVIQAYDPVKNELYYQDTISLKRGYVTDEDSSTWRELARRFYADLWERMRTPVNTRE